MIHLKQSTASQGRIIGPFVDDTDFITPETGLTINASDVKIMKNGGASSNKNSGGGTHRVNGDYSFTFDATDTDTVGEMRVSINVAGALLVVKDFFVLEETVYDALYGASAPGYLQPTTAGRTLDVTAGGTAGIDWGNIENKTTANDLSGTDIQLVDTTTTNTDMISFADIWTTQMTEAYASSGTAPTPAQALFLLQQFMTQASNSGTTRTVKELDNSTTAATFTYDDASAPTSVERTT